MKLQTLRTRLNQLRRRRFVVRQTTAWSAVVLAVLWLAAAAFVVDWLLLMNVPQRLVAWGIGLAVAAWAFWRYTKPWVGVKEDVVDVALLVERHQHIDSDLVAALQFQDRDAPKWGSPQLESAVIEYVEEFSPSLDVFEGFTYRRFKRRVAWLAGTLAVIIGFMVIFPSYAGAFANRMLLGSLRYPTDTTIERIAINGQTVYARGGGQVSLRVAYGVPLDFEVTGQGVLPEQGLVRLKSEESGSQVTVDLGRGIAGDRVTLSNASPSMRDSVKPKTEESSESSGEEQNETEGQAVYQGRLPRLVGTVTYQVFLGDAWTDPLEIKVIPLPVVTVSLDPKPPKYAVSAGDDLASIREGTRQISVIEGTSVALNLESTNKPLKKAVLTVDEDVYPLEKIDQAGLRWRLAEKDSPLREIRRPVKYSVQVEDEDGLVLEQPIEGFIRIRADRKPRILPPVLEVPLVRPVAITPIEYSITDDYGLSRIDLKVQVVRKVPMMYDGAEEMMDQVDHTIREVKSIPIANQPVTNLSDTYHLELEQFQLSPGDELKVTLEAYDFRGEFEPQSTISEPLVLKVTDGQGVLLGTGELDKRSAQSLDDLIKAYSGDSK